MINDHNYLIIKIIKKINSYLQIIQVNQYLKMIKIIDKL